MPNFIFLHFPTPTVAQLWKGKQSFMQGSQAIERVSSEFY